MTDNVESEYERRTKAGQPHKTTTADSTAEQIEGEEWRPVVGFDNYEVSSIGRVRSYRGWGNTRLTNPKFLTQQTLYGYRQVPLQKNGKGRPLKVSRLVLEAFVGLAPVDKPFARHKNTDSQDNRVENLAWGSVRQNYEDGRKANKNASGGRGGTASLTDAQARDIVKRVNDGEQRYKLAKEYNINVSIVNNILIGKSYSSATGIVYTKKKYTYNNPYKKLEIALSTKYEHDFGVGEEDNVFIQILRTTTHIGELTRAIRTDDPAAIKTKLADAMMCLAYIARNVGVSLEKVCWERIGQTDNPHPSA